MFEEGIGTYRMSRARSPRGLRWVKWRAIAARHGCGWEFGSGRRTDHVMVSRPDAFRRLHPRLAEKVVGFPGVVDELRHEADAWRRTVLRALGEPSLPLGRVALVLGTWGGTAPDTLARAVADADVVFEKPHPHDGVTQDRPGVVPVTASWIPAEAIIETLASVSDHLTVYHHSSSAAFYAHGRYDGVEFVDLLGTSQLREVLAALG